MNETPIRTGFFPSKRVIRERDDRRFHFTVISWFWSETGMDGLIGWERGVDGMYALGVV